jgi:prepilin-type N-terminal cleavage/methylation domain-containing protein
MNKKNKKSNGGFTLIELMVSVSIFAVVMTICMGAIMTVFNANRKSETVRAVMDNLNSSLEEMTRSIMFGSTYHCDITVGDIATPAPNDCGGGASSLVLKLSDGSVVTYKLSGSRIVETVAGIDYYLTSPDVTIQSMTFYVFGSSPNDWLQPRVIVTVKGYASDDSVQSTFNLETTLSQRKFDYQ